MDSSNKIMLHLFFIMVLDLLAFTCILPLFPSLMDYYAMKSEEGDLYYTLTKFLRFFQNLIGAPQNYKYNSVLFGGFLGSMFSFLQFFSSPIVGAISDVKGRKPLLIASTVGSLLSYILWSQAFTFPLFILSRFVGGLSKASVSVATAIVADVSSKKSRIKGMVLIGAAFSAGFILGPMIGALFARQSHAQMSMASFPKYPPFFAIFLSLVELLWIVCFLPETLAEKKNKIAWNEIWDKSFNFLSLSRNPKKEQDSADIIERLGLINFLFLIVYSGLEFTLTFFTHLLFDYTSMQQGQIYFIIGILMVAIQGGYVRRQPSEKQSSVTRKGLISTLISFLLISITGIVHSKVTLYIGLSFFAFGSATVVTSLTTLLSSSVSEMDQGAALGVFRSRGALARAIGPFIASAVFWIFGASICYAAGALALLILYFMIKNTKMLTIKKVDTDINANLIND